MNYNKNFAIDMKISYICQNEYNYFLDKKGVVGVALGYKITHGFSTFKKCITVFVRKKLMTNSLSSKNIIPRCYRGIMTDVIESGAFKFNSLDSRVRPVINGYSLGNISSEDTGTCGCLVHDKFIYILSSNHVLALNNEAKIESVILQPSTQDKGTVKKDVIGHLNRFIPIKFTKGREKPENIVDCALCKVINRSFVSPDIAFIGTPHGTGKASLNLDVQKVGRTTELTHGQVINLCGTTLVEISPEQSALFKNQIYTTRMSQDGDSGALLLTQDKLALGLLMGGSDQRTIYNPIDKVLKDLNVELITS